MTKPRKSCSEAPRLAEFAPQNPAPRLLIKN